MNAMHPQLVVRYIILSYDPNTGKQVPTYRSNSAVLRSNWGKPIPLLTVPGSTPGSPPSIYAFISNYIVDMRLNVDFLAATAHIPIDTPPNAPELHMSEWGSAQHLADQLQWAIMHSEEKHSQEWQDATKEHRAQCIRRVADKHLAPGDTYDDMTRPQLDDIATLFLVGRRVVMRALGLKDTQKASSGSVYMRSPMSLLRDDPRYKTIARAVARAKSNAFQRGLTSRFSTKDILPRSAGMFTLPVNCPVLGVPLNYTLPEDGPSKNPWDVRVWRKSVTQDLTPGNVAIMSALAARMIEGKKIAQHTAERLTHGAPYAQDAWTAWRRENTVATDAPEIE